MYPVWVSSQPRWILLSINLSVWGSMFILLYSPKGNYMERCKRLGKKGSSPMHSSGANINRAVYSGSGITDSQRALALQGNTLEAGGL